VINTAIVYMHRFFMHHSFKVYHRNVSLYFKSIFVLNMYYLYCIQLILKHNNILLPTTCVYLLLNGVAYYSGNVCVNFKHVVLCILWPPGYAQKQFCLKFRVNLYSIQVHENYCHSVATLSVYESVSF